MIEPAAVPTPTRIRIESIDLLKGLVMVIMALDHVRDYFHYDVFFFNPNDPTQTNVALFFTRFITNFCAPAFSFLAGLSAFMVGQRKGRSELSLFLLKRGLWLVFVEIVIMNFGWHFDPFYHDVVIQVIWALGVSMIVLAGLIHLPINVIIAFSCVLIFGHNLLDTVHFEGSIFWSILHERNFFEIFPGHSFGGGYGLIPWVAVMSLGYCFGTAYDKSADPSQRRKLFNTIGLAALALFIVLRWTNFYGNLLPWKSYDTIAQTMYSFFSLTKYPPSLTYLLVTLGGTLLFLANSEKLKGSIVDFFCVFGRVPFFYYIIHIYLIHFLALLAAEFTGFGWEKMILPFMPTRVVALRGYGFSLGVTYLVWIAVVAMLYPLCKAFDQYKQNNKQKWWLSYL